MAGLLLYNSTFPAFVDAEQLDTGVDCNQDRCGEDAKQRIGHYNYPLPNLPPEGKEQKQILSPLGEIRKGVKVLSK
jgi:hypothetical protein